jgi:hypothetical protein
METEKELSAFLERMDKGLSDSPRASRRGRHRVAFIALRPIIEGALAHGYTMKATWAALRKEKKLSMSYQTFRTYCRRAGIGQHMQAAATDSLLRPEPPRQASGVTARFDISAPSDAPQRGFRHERVPRKGDIYG